MTPDQIATKADIAAPAENFESCRFSRKPLVFKAAPAWPLTRTGRERRVKV